VSRRTCCLRAHGSIVPLDGVQPSQFGVATIRWIFQC
jgi:hypothetical protein